MPHKPDITSLHITDTHSGHIDPQTHRPIGSYTTYAVTVGFEDGTVVVVRRRYSEFEQLREHLVRHYPHLIIPPIPEKHTLRTIYIYMYIADIRRVVETVIMYTSIVKKEDVKMTEKRKRLLESFLNNILKSDTLSNDTVFRLFLKESLEWAEESLKLLDLQDKTMLLPVGTVEQAAKKYDGLIDGRLLEHEHVFVEMKGGIGGLEEAERNRFKKTLRTGCMY